MGAKITDYNGRLIKNCDVIGQAGKRPNQTCQFWKLRCRACGAEFETRSSQLSIEQTGHKCAEEKLPRTKWSDERVLSIVPMVPLGIRHCSAMGKRVELSPEEKGRREAILYMMANRSENACRLESLI